MYRNFFIFKVGSKATEIIYNNGMNKAEGTCLNSVLSIVDNIFMIVIIAIKYF